MLDAALALEPHIDINQPLHRQGYARPAPSLAGYVAEQGSTFSEKFYRLPGETKSLVHAAQPNATLPPQPEYDLLWFIAQYAPDMEGWERDIFLAVREESFYFYPVFACQIMNEGWASYWHARLLREADFLPDDLYLSAVKAHSDVVRPFAGEHQLSLAINPYHLGFSMWEELIKKYGVTAARKICKEEDDFGFVRNHLSQELAGKIGLFIYESDSEGGLHIAERDIHAIREAILAPRFNYGAPRIAVTRLHTDGSLELRHDYKDDGAGQIGRAHV